MKRWIRFYVGATALGGLSGAGCVSVGHSSEIGCLVDMTEPACGGTVRSDAGADTEAASDSAAEPKPDAALDAAADASVEVADSAPDVVVTTVDGGGDSAEDATAE